MKEIIRKFGRWLNSIGQDDLAECQPVTSSGMYGSHISKGSARFADGIYGSTFTVFPAVGGQIVQFSTYDTGRDRYNMRLYIVMNDSDMGEELAQILTREGLAR